MDKLGDKQKQRTSFAKLSIKQASESAVKNAHNGDNKKKMYEAFLSQLFTTAMSDLLNRV